MLANLKVRTCIALVVFFYSLAMVVSNGVSWIDLNEADKKLNLVNDTYSFQQTNVYESYVLILRARLTLWNSYVELRANEVSLAVEDLKRSRDQLTRANAAFAKFLAQPKLPGGEAMEVELEKVFKNYVDIITSQITVLERQDTVQFLDMVSSARKSTADFEAAANQFLAFIDKATNQMAADAGVDHRNAQIITIALLIIAAILSILTWVFMSRMVLRPLVEAGGHFDKLAAGDFTGRVDVRNDNEIGHLFASLKRMQESLSRTVATVRRGVEEINVGAHEIAAGNTDLSSRTEQQAASLEETAASMEQLASTVKQNADNARQANQLASSASDVAERGGSAVSEVVHTMQDISSASHRISEIVSVIDGIAFQTNILALNAAVEAARAGEQGKGFAVVAGEVRSLAQRSAQAAKEIKGLIEDSVSKVDTGSQQVERAGATMAEIVSSVRRVTDIMSEISAASDEQSSGIDQVNRAVSQMDEVTQQNAALVEQAAAAAGSLEEQATRLTQAVAVFKINGGEVIDVAAQQLPTYSSTSQRRTASKPAPLASTRRPAVSSGAAPARRPAAPARTPIAAPKAEAASSSRRQAPSDDDWESF